MDLVHVNILKIFIKCCKNGGIIFCYDQYSVIYKARKLNEICSGNLYPFFLESVVEHILATRDESRLSDNVSTFSQDFQDCILN